MDDGASSFMRCAGGGAMCIKQRLQRATDWLLHNANSDGGWGTAIGHKATGMHIGATIVALDALRRSSVPVITSYPGSRGMR
jgi:hypothetical protein